MLFLKNTSQSPRQRGIARSFNKGIEQAVKNGQMHKSRLDVSGNFLAQAIGAEYIPGPLKTEERARAKTLGKYNGDPGEIKDISRGMIIVTDPEQILLLRALLSETHLKGRKVLSDLDRKHHSKVAFKEGRFGTPDPKTGYRNIDLLIETSSKRSTNLSEIQIVTAGFNSIYDLTHSIHEIVRIAEEEPKITGQPLSRPAQNAIDGLNKIRKTLHDTMAFKEDLIELQSRSPDHAYDLDIYKGKKTDFEHIMIELLDTLQNDLLEQAANDKNYPNDFIQIIAQMSTLQEDYKTSRQFNHSPSALSSPTVT